MSIQGIKHPRVHSTQKAHPFTASRVRLGLVGSILLSLVACLPDTSLSLDADQDGYPVTAEGAGDCDDANSTVFPGAPELCDGIDNSCNGQIDEDSPDEDANGIADCVDTEICDGIDNDGDGTLDEGFSDTDRDGIADCIETETCDGLDNDGNGEIDELFSDTNDDGEADCIDEDSDCTGDVDRDGTPNCIDIESCDGRDNDGDSIVDEGFSDTDQDGTKDCVDPETCDGKDNDGDGKIDDGFPDSDGNGTPDCRSAEICDGTDNDGDGAVDEGHDADWLGGADCIDDDGDGFTELTGDCNDDSELASPAFLYELGDDLVDNNCNGSVDEVSLVDVATTVISGAPQESFAGAALALVDLNGDGLPERLIGAPGDAAAPSGLRPPGVVYLERGTGSLPTGGSLVSASKLTRLIAGDALGSAICVARKETGAASYLAISAPATNGGAGAVTVWRVKSSLEAFVAQTPLVIYGTTSGDGLGTSLASLGDINGDEVPELAVGVPRASVNTSQGLVRAGAVYVFSGAELLSASSLTPSDALKVLPGGTDGSRYGEAMVSLADFDDDGVTELAIGAPGHSTDLLTGVGRVSLFYGSDILGCSGTACPLNLEGELSGEQLGASLGAPGDVFGYGVGTLLVGSFPVYLTSPVDYEVVHQLFLGGPRATLDPDGDRLLLRSQAVMSLAGAHSTTAIGFAGGGEDVSGDGLPDLLLGIPDEGSSLYSTAYAQVFVLDAERMLDAVAQDQALLLFTSLDVARRLGWSVAAGDLNGDGTKELLMGAPGLDGGVVYLLPTF